MPGQQPGHTNSCPKWVGGGSLCILWSLMPFRKIGCLSHGLGSSMGLIHQLPAGHSGQVGSERRLVSPAQAQGPCRSQGNSLLTADPGTDSSLSIHSTEPDIPMSHPSSACPGPPPLGTGAKLALVAGQSSPEPSHGLSFFELVGPLCP